MFYKFLGALLLSATVIANPLKALDDTSSKMLASAYTLSFPMFGLEQNGMRFVRSNPSFFSTQ